MSENIKIIHGECEKVIPTLKNNSIDLVVTSPPYNVDLGNNKYNDKPYDAYKDNKDHFKYIAWLKGIFKDIHQKLKSGGRVVINIGDGKNGRVPTHVDIIHFMTRELTYLPMANIVWNKNQIGNRTAWGSFCSPSAPSFPKPFEYIMVFAKDNLKLQEKGITDLSNENFIKWSLALWNITGETKMSKYGHPAMFPTEIPHRLIQMLSWVDALVLDPFNGAGTTGVVCEQLKRRYIGIEISEEYCDISRRRIKDTRAQGEIDMFAKEYD